MLVEGTCENKYFSPSVTVLKRSPSDKFEVKSIFHIVKNKDKTKVVRLLTEAGNKFDPSSLNNDGETPFVMVCKCKKIGNAFTLLDIYGEAALPHFITASGYNAIYYASQDAPNLVDRILMFPMGLTSVSHVYPTGETILMKLIKNQFPIQAMKVIDHMSYESINTVDGDGKTALIIACEYNYFDIASYLINKGAILTFYDKSGNSALSYLLRRSETHYSKDFIDLCMLFIEPRVHQFKEQNEKFIRYDSERFTSIVDLSETQSGNFGSMKWCVDSITGQHKILKYYKSYIGNITDDIVKEILFIKKMNEKNNSAVRINGMYIDDDNHFYIVMEPLAMTLYDFFKLISFYQMPQIARLNRIFNKIVSITEDIHSLGIVHCDLKMENLMFGFDGEIYVIDFGISDFIGISPYKHIIQNYVTTSYIKAPDTEALIDFIIVKEVETSQFDSCGDLSSIVNGEQPEKSKRESPSPPSPPSSIPITITRENNSPGKKSKVYKELKRFNFLTSRKSYSCDIYSVGVTFIQGILKKNARFLSYKGDIFRVIKKDPTKKESQDKKEKEIIIEQISQQDLSKLKMFPFFKNLVKMINIDGKLRIDRTSLTNFPTDYCNNDDSLTNRSIHYSSSEIKNNLCELVYSDKVFSSFSKQTLTMCQSKDSNSEYLDIMKKMIKFKNERVSIDTYLNTLYNCVNYSGDEDKIIIFISYFYIFSFTFEWFATDMTKLAELFEIPEHILSGKINTVINSVLPSISFIPFSTLIAKMVINLQKESYPSDLIAKTEKLIFENLSTYLISKAKDETIYVWDFIQSFTYLNVGGASFEVEFNDDSILNVFNRF